MFKRLSFAFAFAFLGVMANTQNALAFNPTRDELAIGTAVFALGAMVLLTVIYAFATALGINKPDEVDFPDHEHDHRYAGHH